MEIVWRVVGRIHRMKMLIYITLVCSLNLKHWEVKFQWGSIEVLESKKSLVLEAKSLWHDDCCCHTGLLTIKVIET